MILVKSQSSKMSCDDVHDLLSSMIEILDELIVLYAGAVSCISY